MNEEKTDRRVKYTIMVLKDALVTAMQTEHISKISVKSLCELADVNRSTFYAHFRDQYDLLRVVQREALDKIAAYLRGQDFNESRPISQQALIRILDYVKENANLFKALFSDNGDPDIRTEIMDLTQIFPMDIYESAGERIRGYMAGFGAMGCISVLQKWLNDGMPESTTQIADLIIQILFHGVASFESVGQQTN